MKKPLLNPAFRKFRRMVIGSFLLVSACALTFIIVVGSSLPDFSVLESTQSDLSTVIFSRDGQVIGNYYAEENRINVQLHEIPQNLKDALIATEDVRFFNHAGIDLQAQLRAVSQIATGQGMQGGSTISMQLARNLYVAQVGQDKSILRKIREMVAASFLERRYTKDEIMMHYLNTVPFLGVRFGVQSAARYFFNKDCKDLTISESALLIGMLKGGSYYNPHRHPERALNRRNTVVEQMEKYGFITEAQSDSIQRLPLGVVAPSDFDHNEGLAPYFREELRQWLKTWCDENGHDLYRDGLRVYTTIDTRIQRHLEVAVRKHLQAHQREFDAQTRVYNYAEWDRDTTILVRAMRQSSRYNVMLGSGHSRADIERSFREPVPMQVFSWEAPNNVIDTILSPWDSLRYYARFLEAGAVMVEPSTGQVLAWAGGADYRFFKYDHVNKGRRQVGSTFKPFVYTAAFDNGYSPCYRVMDEPGFVYETEDGQRWTPRNSDGRYRGCVNLRTSLAQSLNIPTARLMKVVGPRVVAEYAYKMGIKSQLEIVPSLALGTTDLNVLELTSAYGTFANMGRWVEPTFVTRIEDRHGNVIKTFIPNSRRALSPETSYLMIDILRAVINGGTGAGLRYTHGLGANIDIGGKTGTTQNNSDGWFVGFTPQFCMGVWVGHADRNVHFLSTLYGQGAAMALPIWGYTMKGVFEDPELAIRPRDFDAPEELRVETDCLVFQRTNGNTGCGAEGSTNNNTPYLD